MRLRRELSRTLSRTLNLRISTVLRKSYQGELNLLTRTLTRLFGELPPSLSANLSRLTLEQLRQALDVAFEVSTATEFEATITNWPLPSTI